MRTLSIRAVMAGVVIAAIGLAAVRTCSPAWAGAMLSVTFFTLTASLLGVAFRRGPRRIYWIGFATLGWTYLLLWFVPYLHQNVGQFLLAPNLLSYIEHLLHAEPQAAGGLQSIPVVFLGAAATGGGFAGGGFGGPSTYIDPMPCIRLGASIEALVWAALGGRAAIYFAAEEIAG